MQKENKKPRAILLQMIEDRSTTYTKLRACAASEAMFRLDEGSYGICVDCGRNIPKARLNALPETARCIECQSALEGKLVEV